MVIDHSFIVNVRCEWMDKSFGNTTVGELLLLDLRDTLTHSNRSRLEEIENYAYYGEPHVTFESDSEEDYYRHIKRELELERQ